MLLHNLIQLILLYQLWLFFFFSWGNWCRVPCCFTKRRPQKALQAPIFFSLCWAEWFKTENTFFCLKFLTTQFECEEASSLFSSDSSLYRSMCQCTIWGHYPDWGHQGDLYSSLCHWAGHAGNWRCCLHAKWDQCSRSSLFSALGPIDHCQWTSAGSPLK